MTIINSFLRLGLIAIVLSVLTILAVVGCSSTEVEPTPYDRADFTPVAGPPPFPIIFEGKFTVDGEPGPADSTIYAEFIHGGSPISTTYAVSYTHLRAHETREDRGWRLVG